MPTGGKSQEKLFKAVNFQLYRKRDHDYPTHQFFLPLGKQGEPPGRGGPLECRGRGGFRILEIGTMDRDALKSRVAPLELYKFTLRTNCGECGQKSCLAFATLAVTGRGEIDACPHLDPEKVKPLRERLLAQLGSGIGVSREGFEKTMEYLSGEIEKCDFLARAESIGAEVREARGGIGLVLRYLNQTLLVTKSDMENLSGGPLSAWEKILAFNYVIAGGAAPSGVWVGMESLPNSVSKIKSLKAHCEEVLARLYGGGIDALSKAVSPWGREIFLKDQGVDFAAEFGVFPKLGIRLLFWDEVREEGYPCKVKFLFDSRVLQVIDLESLLFACEQITDRLSTFAHSENGNPQQTITK